MKKVNRTAILETVAMLEADIVLAKIGCRGRGLRALSTPQQGVRWILQHPRRQRDLRDLREAIHPLYATLAHLRGRIHATDGDKKLMPLIDAKTRKALPLEDQSPDFQRAWVAQEAFVQKIVEAFPAVTKHMATAPDAPMTALLMPP